MPQPAQLEARAVAQGGGLDIDLETRFRNGKNGAENRTWAASPERSRKKNSTVPSDRQASRLQSTQKSLHLRKLREVRGVDFNRPPVCRSGPMIPHRRGL